MEEVETDFRGAISPPEVYTEIENFWDGALDRQLIERIVAAPDDHLLAARDQWPKVSVNPSHEMETTDEFGLRPIIHPDFHGDFAADVQRVASLSLHCDEVILDSNILFPFGAEDPQNDWNLPPKERLSVDERIQVGRSLTALLEMRPLVQTHAIQFGHLRDLGDLNKDLLPTVLEWVEELRQQPGLHPPFDELRYRSQGLEAQAAISGCLRLVRDGYGTPTATNLLEKKLWSAIMDGQPVDGQTSRLQTLTSLPLPQLSSKIEDIVDIRQSDEALAKWRSAMKLALEDVARLAEDPACVNKATTILGRNLRAELGTLEKSFGRSQVLSAARTGTKDMVINGVGPALLIASDPVAAAAVAGGTAIVSSAVEYLRTRRARRTDRAIWDIAICYGDWNRVDAK